MEALTLFPTGDDAEEIARAIRERTRARRENVKHTEGTSAISGIVRNAMASVGMNDVEEDTAGVVVESMREKETGEHSGQKVCEYSEPELLI